MRPFRAAVASYARQSAGAKSTVRWGQPTSCWMSFSSGELIVLKRMAFEGPVVLINGGVQEDERRYQVAKKRRNSGEEEEKKRSGRGARLSQLEQNKTTHEDRILNTLEHNPDDP